jgi:hypothetical protein
MGITMGILGNFDNENEIDIKHILNYKVQNKEEKKNKEEKILKEEKNKEKIENNINIGIVPRCINEIFEYFEKEKERISKNKNDEERYVCTINFIQIYMEQVQDLLNPETGNNLILRETPKSNEITIQGVRNVDVKTKEEAISVVNEGLKNRSVAPTLMNITSSRAHTVLIFQIKHYSKTSLTELK